MSLSGIIANLHQVVVSRSPTDMEREKLLVAFGEQKKKPLRVFGAAFSKSVPWRL